jgi:hypothetical protein
VTQLATFLGFFGEAEQQAGDPEAYRRVR